jgi:hypothetical protein
VGRCVAMGSVEYPFPIRHLSTSCSRPSFPRFVHQHVHLPSACWTTRKKAAQHMHLTPPATGGHRHGFGGYTPYRYLHFSLVVVVVVVVRQTSSSPLHNMSTPFPLLLGASLLAYISYAFVQYRRLSHIPGPWYAAVSKVWMVWTSLQGRQPDAFKDVGEKYGTSVTPVRCMCKTREG